MKLSKSLEWTCFTKFCHFYGGQIHVSTWATDCNYSYWFNDNNNQKLPEGVNRLISFWWKIIKMNILLENDQIQDPPWEKLVCFLKQSYLSLQFPSPFSFFHSIFSNKFMGKFGFWIFCVLFVFKPQDNFHNQSRYNWILFPLQPLWLFLVASSVSGISWRLQQLESECRCNDSGM